MKQREVKYCLLSHFKQLKKNGLQDIIICKWTWGRLLYASGGIDGRAIY